ncbi:hypothetical protein D8Y20_07855 [Mariprofundus sp. EBB-1]|uniref:hypothetical protein n=1 Tax=Mariprofundus sp. EBB-1 TaxID=2650971 RepID=UPI000EF1D534|nr:hypothetical protein [Mariprofundus sp. EBB-1]RLL52185.1 hypothetical protein D8Y20_07855 [Mariprofundus sp. EBB-1]
MDIDKSMNAIEIIKARSPKIGPVEIDSTAIAILEKYVGASHINDGDWPELCYDNGEEKSYLRILLDYWADAYSFPIDANLCDVFEDFDKYIEGEASLQHAMLYNLPIPDDVLKVHFHKLIEYEKDEADSEDIIRLLRFLDMAIQEGLFDSKAPEIFVKKIFAEHGARGGKLHHADDRQAFKSDYRDERGDEPDHSPTRPSICTSLKPHYPSVADSTMLKWAKEADKEDGFNRKSGRPKKGE